MENTTRIAGDTALDRAPLSPAPFVVAGTPFVGKPAMGVCSVMTAPVPAFRTTGVVRLRQGGAVVPGSTRSTTVYGPAGPGGHPV